MYASRSDPSGMRVSWHAPASSLRLKHADTAAKYSTQMGTAPSQGAWLASDASASKVGASCAPSKAVDASPIWRGADASPAGKVVASKGPAASSEPKTGSGRCAASVATSASTRPPQATATRRMPAGCLRKSGPTTARRYGILVTDVQGTSARSVRTRPQLLPRSAPSAPRATRRPDRDPAPSARRRLELLTTVARIPATSESRRPPRKQGRRLEQQVDSNRRSSRSPLGSLRGLLEPKRSLRISIALGLIRGSVSSCPSARRPR
jgi:hypothetical protein